MSEEAKRSKSRLYKLGRNVICIVNCADDYIARLDHLLPHYTGPDLSEEEIYEIHTGCSQHIPDILRGALRRHRHSDCAWINASLLRAPNGKIVLIAGKSAGKTTICLALGLGYGWKVAADNYFVVDYENKKLVSYNAPCFFKDTSLELLNRSIGRVPDSMIDYGFRKSEKWAPLGEIAADGEYDLRFDLSILLEQTDSDVSKIVVSPISASEYLMKLLAQSSLLKAGTSATAQVSKALGAGPCLRITGGELEERLDAILTNVQPHGVCTPLNTVAV